MDRREYLNEFAEKIREYRADPSRWNQLNHYLWERGRVSHVLRPHGQREVFNFLRAGHNDARPIIANCHRRLGKSVAALLLAVARCLEKPYHLAKFAAPEKDQAARIIKENEHVIFRHCPAHLRPILKDGAWIFRNPLWDDKRATSVLSWHGANHQKGNSLRGLACDTLIFDEIRDFRHLKYIYEDVCAFQLADRDDPFCAFLTTPPKSMDHDVVRVFIPKARREGRYIAMPASRNKDWKKREDDRVLAVHGSKDSIGYRREAECELISETESLILPEWQDVRDSLIVNTPRPEHFDAYIVYDMGWSDYMAVGFWRFDFKRQKRVLEDEFVAHNISTGELVRNIKQIAERNYYDKVDGELQLKKNVRSLRAYADAQRLTLEDMKRDHGFKVRAVDKYDADTSLANLRTGIGEGKVEINPRCEEHIYQFDNGIWNDNRTDFVRSEGLGHCDCIAESVYAYRMINPRRNPYPKVKHNYHNMHVRRRFDADEIDHPLASFLCED